MAEDILGGSTDGFTNSGSFSSTSAAGVSVYTGGAYPARPSGFGMVFFIGPSDPGVLAVDGDVWISTA